MNIQTIRNQIEYLRQAGEDVSDLIAFAEKWRYVMSKLPNAVETRPGSKYPYKVPAGTKMPKKEKAATPAKKKDSPKPKPSSAKKPKAEMIADALKVALEHIKEYHPDATHDDFIEALGRMSGKSPKPEPVKSTNVADQFKNKLNNLYEKAGKNTITDNDIEKFFSQPELSGTSLNELRDMAKSIDVAPQSMSKSELIKKMKSHIANRLGGHKMAQNANDAYGFMTGETKSKNVADQFKAAYAKLNDGETLDKIGYDGLTKAVNDLFDEVGVDATNFKSLKGEASGIYKTPSSVGVLKKRIVDNLKERLGRFHRAQNIQKEFEGGKNAGKVNPEPKSDVGESEEPEKMEEPEEVKYKTEELSNTAKHALKQLMRGKILKQDTNANRFNEFGIFEPNGEPISRVPNEDGQMLSQHEDLVEVKPGEFRFQPNHSEPASKPDASSMAFKIAYSPHSDKMSRKLDDVYGDIVKSAHPDMKPDDFKSIMEKAQREGALELHKINEVRNLSDQAKQVMPTTDDGHGGKDYFGYAVVKDRAKLEQVINDHLSNLDKGPADAHPLKSMLDKISENSDSVSYQDINVAVDSLKDKPISEIAGILKSFGSSTDWSKKPKSKAINEIKSWLEEAKGRHDRLKGVNLA